MLSNRFDKAGVALLTLCLTCLMSRTIAEGMVLTGSVEASIQQAETETSPASPGVVGLDMVIRPAAFPVVRDVFRYSPAHLSGIHPGDQILAVNGQSTMGKSTWQVDQEISDVPGVVVGLTVKRGAQVWNTSVTVASLNEVHPALRALYASSSY